MVKHLSSTKQNFLLEEERMLAANPVPKLDSSLPQPVTPIPFEERMRAVNLVFKQEPPLSTFPSAIERLY